MDNCTFLNVVDIRTKNLINNKLLTNVQDIYYYNNNDKHIYIHIKNSYKMFKINDKYSYIIDIDRMRSFIRKNTYTWHIGTINVIVNIHSIGYEMLWVTPSNIILAPWSQIKVNINENVADLSNVSYPNPSELNYFIINKQCTDKCRENYEKECCKKDICVEIYYYRIFFYRINQSVKLIANINNDNQIEPEYNYGFNINDKYIEFKYTNWYNIRLDMSVNKLAQIITNPTPIIYLNKNNNIADKWYITSTDLNIPTVTCNAPVTSLSQSYFSTINLTKGDIIYFNIDDLYDQLYNVEKMRLVITI